MRKSVLAVTAGLLLVAGQAAAGNTATVRVGDRVGAKSGAANEFAAEAFVPWLIVGAAVVTATVVANEDDSPTSP
ncbi:hypothetical protein [Caulobacter sp. 17J80-11]|uniref:hypothetical protein n=1 Tax=Caulobacter sp. 17J80-11 TaxID=2763502 RepID=UPI00165383AE|nr:hypothetical protein [Caulobacter sp. 17J80-11]MBC6980482.1 hypothetical protein [Caulobacter sp. 17J80-11]